MNLMTPAKQRFLPVLCISLSAVTAVAYFLAMKNDFDAEIGHFAYSSVPFILCVAALCLSALVTAAMGISSKKYVYSARPNNSSLYFFGSALTAILSLIVFFIGISDAGRTVYSSEGTGISFSEISINAKLELIETILTPFIGISFILSMIEKTKTSKIRAVFSVAGALCINFSLFACYFDFEIPLNSPVKNITIIAESCLLLYLLSEAGLAFPESEKKASYSFSLFSSAAVSSISLGISVGAMAERIISPTVGDPNLSLLHCAMYLAISLTAVARIISLNGCAKKASDKTV